MLLSADPSADKLRAGRVAAAMLALVAGFVDAYGYLGWHLFGANMTGNTVIFAISLFSSPERAREPLTLIVLFFAGAMLGRLIMDRFSSYTGLYAEAGLLTVAPFVPHEATLPVISLAMGLQNTALSTFAGVAANTSFLSGDYTKLGQVIADIAVRRGTEADRQAVAIIWPLIVAYALGALLSASINTIPLRLLLVVPVVATLAFATHRKLLNPA
jgi:uncharacterized membrane protein YoaK (UPF0700 family)